MIIIKYHACDKVDCPLCSILMWPNNNLLIHNHPPIRRKVTVKKLRDEHPKGVHYGQFICLKIKQVFHRSGGSMFKTPDDAEKGT